MNCSGPCEQGRRPCPTPEACERAEYIDSTVGPIILLILFVGVLAALAWRLFT